MYKRQIESLAPEVKDLTRTEMTELMEHIFSLSEVQRAVRHKMCIRDSVLTDPKGTVLIECGKLLQRAGYRIKVLNTINFKKSMHYNPFVYILSLIHI